MEGMGAFGTDTFKMALHAPKDAIPWLTLIMWFRLQTLIYVEILRNLSQNLSQFSKVFCDIRERALEFHIPISSQNLEMLVLDSF